MKIYLLIFITLLTLIFSKVDEITIFKALVCVNIITTKRQKEDLEPNTLSPLILSCYIKISEEQVHRITEGIEKGLDIPLSDEEIEHLMDVDSLKDLPENEVRKKGEDLEEAIKEFQKIQEGYGESGDNDDYDDGYDDGDDDYEDYGEGQKNNISSIGFLRLIKKGIMSLGETFFSSWYIIGILVLFYILLLEIRRNNDQNINENKEEDKNEEDKEEKKEVDINNKINNKEEKQKEENEEEKKIEKEKKIEEKKVIKEEKIEKEVKKLENENNKREKQD